MSTERDEQRSAIIFADEGLRRDDDRPEFRELVASLEKDRASREGHPPVVVVTELLRLFRNREDRSVIDRLVDARDADVKAMREQIDTDSALGRARYKRAADLLMQAYEGSALPSDSRAQLVDRYVREV